MTATMNQKSGKGMTHGVVSELSTFFTVRPGHEQEMHAAIERVQKLLEELGPEVHQKLGLREWRQVLFDNGKRLMLITSFETDWDPYIDDALQVFGVDSFIDWLQYTVEAAQNREALQSTIQSARQGGTDTAALKALLQSAQTQATAYFDVLSDQTVPQIRKAQQVKHAFEQVLDHPAAEQALQQPALQLLLERAAD
jgi:hypothetical protein